MNLGFICLAFIGLLIFVSYRSWNGSTGSDRRIADLEVEVNNLKQIVEARGDDNRYYASEKLGRPATEKEALDHYIQQGGARHFARSRSRPTPKQPWPKFIVLGM